jgi:hypothetical protein
MGTIGMIHNALRKALLLGFLLLAAAKGFSQADSTKRLNALKLDLVGPSPIVRSGRIDFSWWRFLGRYERKFNRLNHWSFVADLEYRSWFWAYGLTDSTGNFGLEHHRDLALHMGPRFSFNVLPAKNVDLSIFAEPRLGLEWRRAEVYKGIVGTFDGIVHDFGIVPRIRAGIGAIFFQRIGIEISGEYLGYKIVSDGRHFWEVMPELCLVFCF